MCSNRLTIQMLVLTIAAACCGGAAAAAVEWDGGVDGDMLTSVNWNGDVMPGPGDAIALNYAGGIQPRLDAGDSLTVVNTSITAGTMTIAGDLTSVSLSTSASGNLVLELGGSITGDVINDGSFTLCGVLNGALYTYGRLSLCLGSDGAPFTQYQVSQLDLGGILELDLGGLDYSADTIPLDLFASRTINGSFDAFDFFGLNAAFGFSANVLEGQNNDDVFRIVLSRFGTNPVPTIGTAPLVVIGLFALLALRRRRLAA